MRRRLLVLATLLATALLLWLAWAGEPPPPASGVVAIQEVSSGMAPDAARGRAPAPDRAVRMDRVELPVAPALDLGDPGDVGRLPPDPRIHGLVLRAGQPVPDRQVHVMGSVRAGRTVVLVARTDLLGQYDFPLPGAGTYRVRVAWDGLTEVLARMPALGAPRARPVATAAAHQEIEVKDRPVACDLELPAGCLRVTALDARHREPLADVEVAMTWDTGIDLTGHTNSQGEMTATDLPAGPCMVKLARRGYRMPPSFSLDTSSAWLQEREVLLEPACVLELRVCDESGRCLSAELESVVEVVHETSGAVFTPRRFRPSFGHSPPEELQFDDLLAGPYRVAIVDRLAEQDGEATVRFAAVQAVAPLSVAVGPDRTTVAELRVRRRKYIEILGERRDRHDPSPVLYVERLDPVTGARRALPQPLSSKRTSRPPQFAGYLGEGLYWLTFVGPHGELHRASLLVPGSQARHRIKLPW